MAQAINKFRLLPYQREKIKTITNHIEGRKSVHIYGREGTGKSMLLDFVYDNWKGSGNSLIPIYCRSGRTLREMLLRISEFLLNHFKYLSSVDKFKTVKKIKNATDLKKLSMRGLKNAVFAYMPENKFCVILDHLEYVTPKINAFLSPLYERALVISASRQSWEITDYNFRGNLNYCLYLTPKLRIENLLKKEAFILMEYLYDSLGIKIQNKIRIFEDVFHITDGNPKMIKEIFEKSRKLEYRKDGILNLNLVLIDCKMDKINLQ